MSLSRSVTGREFQRHGPATEKLLSPRRVRVLLVAHVKTSADRSDRRPMSVKRVPLRQLNGIERVNVICTASVRWLIVGTGQYEVATVHGMHVC